MAIAGTLRLARSSSGPTLQALIRGLGHRELLLVLDNFEHLLAAAPILPELLGACDSLRVLVTSRLPLDVDGEHLVDIEPLAVPDPLSGPASDADVERLAEVPAVALFVERVAAIDDRFRLSSDNAELVVSACRTLGGSLLEIELAAARTRVLSLDQLVDRLGRDPLSVLASGRPDRPDRQRSMRATIGWTYELLSADDQAVLSQLSVFEHGFSLEAAEQVVQADPALVLDALEALLDAHLVEPAPAPASAARRLAMPVPVREFARERLHAMGHHEAAYDRLVRHFVALGATAAVGLETAEEQAWLDRIELELDQFRAVLGHLRAHEPAEGVRLAAALGSFWLHPAYLGVGRRHLARALAADQGVGGGDPGAAAMLERLEQGLASARRGGDVDDQLRVIDFLSHVLSLHDDDCEPAVAITDEGIELARRHGRLWWLAQLVQRAAFFADLDGDLTKATTLAAEAWAIARQLGADRLVLHAGLTVLQLPPDEQIDDPPDLSTLFDLATRLHDERLASTVVMSIGVEALFAGQMTEAADRFRTAVRISRDTGYWHAIGFSLMCTAGFAAVAGEPEMCARMHGAARDTIPVLRRGMPPDYFAMYHELLAGARAACGDRFDQLADDTAGLGWDYATDAALTFFDRHTHHAPVPARGPTSLTHRELQVLARIVAGSTNKDIARELSIAPKTVMHHTVSIYRKLGAKGRAEAAAMGERLGLGLAR